MAREDKATSKKDLAPLARRLSESARYVIGGVTPGTWMSPGQPVEPAEQQVKGRAWDFDSGRNIWIEPRAGEMIGFNALRSFAKYCDLVRLAIETRKDQLCAMEWEIQGADGIADDDPRILRLRRFFRRPDGVTMWPSWLRMLLEDLLVIDAPCIYVRPNLDGKPFGLEVIDGATIKPLINEDGRTPLPPDPAYQQVLKGLAAVDYTAAEMLYLPRNPRSHRVYGYGPVEQIMVTVEISLRRQTHKLQYYTEGSTPDLLMELPADWTPEQIQGFDDWWNAKLSGNTAARRRGMFVPQGANPLNVKEQALKDDYDEWLARVIMFAFSLPATPFIRQHSRANDVTQRETAEDEGKLPLMNWVREVCNLIISEYMGIEGITFEWKAQRELDPSMQAAVDKENVTTGTRQIDEIRAERGDAPLNLKPGVVTATGFVAFKSTDYVGSPDAPDAPPQFQQPPVQQPPVAKLAKAHMKPIKREREQVKQHTEEMAGALLVWFRHMAAKMSKAVSAAYAEALAQYDPESISAAVAPHIDAAVSAHIDLAVDDALVKSLGDTLQGIASDGASEALKQVGVDDADILSMANSDAINYAKARGAEMVGKRWVGDELINNPNAQYAITETTRNQLRGYVVNAVREGWRPEELAQKIEAGFPFSEQRARMIARTEVANADVQGNMFGWRKSGVVTGKQWLLSNIHPKTDICDDNAAAGVIPLNEPFPSGDQGPTAHPACECDVVPVVDDR